MHRRLYRAFALCVALLAASCNRSDDADPAKMESYRTTISLEVAEGGNLQRLSVPAGALMNLQRSDYADIRVFDSTGRPLPTALIEGGKLPDAARATSDIPTFPIVGTIDAVKLTGMSLRIDDRNEARIVAVDGRIEPEAGGKAGIVGSLLDTRAIKEPVTSIEIDADSLLLSQAYSALTRSRTARARPVSHRH